MYTKYTKEEILLILHSEANAINVLVYFSLEFWSNFLDKKKKIFLANICDI